MATLLRTPADDDLISRVFLFEGGSDYSNYSTDAGGPTKFGITEATLAKWRKVAVTAADVQDLTEAEARDIIWQQYLVGPGINRLVDSGLRLAMVDFTVLFGPDDSVPALQHLVGVAVDGVLGPITAAAANSREARQLVNWLAAARIRLHAQRVVAQPSQLVFLRGWLNRALGFIN